MDTTAETRVGRNGKVEDLAVGVGGSVGSVFKELCGVSGMQENEDTGSYC